MCNEPTTVNGRARVNASFDVRGTPLRVGDSVRGIVWPEADCSWMLSCLGKHLDHTSVVDADPTRLVGSHVYTCTEAQWRDLTQETEGAIMVTTEMMDRAAFCVSRFMRVVLDVPSTDKDAEDKFYTILHLLEPDAHAGINQVHPDSVLVLVPRQQAGYPNLVVSEMTSSAALLTMMCYQRPDSTMLRVSTFAGTCFPELCVYVQLTDMCGFVGTGE